MRARIMLLALVAGCGATSNATSACIGAETSTLTGVTIRASGACKFTLAQAAAGITIPYQILVTADVPNVVVQTQTVGGCGGPNTSGLIVFEDLAGGGRHYCLCDTGLCAGPSTAPVTIKAGTYGVAFSWDGKNWSGPSDTGNREGLAFPAGAYTLKISAIGTVGGVSFTVEEDWSITLTS